MYVASKKVTLMRKCFKPAIFQKATRGQQLWLQNDISCKQVYRQMTPGFLYQMNLVKSTRTQTDDFKNGTSQTNIKVWLLPSFICSL